MDETLWTCLAGLAMQSRNLDTAEEAYAAIELLDKVACLQYIKVKMVKIKMKVAAVVKIKNSTVQTAEICLLGGNVDDAEKLLIQNELHFRAVYLNMCMHRWTRALDLAVKFKTHVDTVLLYRQKYLQSFDKDETNSKFLQFKDMEINQEIIISKVTKALEIS